MNLQISLRQKRFEMIEKDPPLKINLDFFFFIIIHSAIDHKKHLVYSKFIVSGTFSHCGRRIRPGTISHTELKREDPYV
jgi:hypothetical protein